MIDEKYMENSHRFWAEWFNAGLQQRETEKDVFTHWLCGTDFFEAPASTKYHGAVPGGLCAHSLGVLDTFERLFGDDYRAWRGDDDAAVQSIVLVCLLHDVCKAGKYIELSAEEQAARGQRYVTAAEALPLGHGEKSIWMIEHHGLRLTEEEAVAIRWHMGAFNDHDNLRDLDAAFDRYPLAVWLHLADMAESHAPTM